MILDINSIIFLIKLNSLSSVIKYLINLINITAKSWNYFKDLILVYITLFYQ